MSDRDEKLRAYAIEGYRYALSLSHDSHDAEDLVQEAISRLYRSYGGIRHKNLLYRTIRNLFFDKWRKSKLVSMESYEEKSGLLESIADGQRRPGAKSDVEEALSILRPEERELVFLRYNEGFSAADIARLTSKGRGTVLSALYRAEQKMKRHMNQGTAKAAE